MEDRKAAPVLRARFLRSYVPLRLRSERKCVLRHHTSLSRRPFSIIQIRISENRKNPELFRLQLPGSKASLLPGSPAVSAVKAPLSFCLMRNCEGNFRTGKQKTEVQGVFGCAFQKRGTGNSDDSGMSLEK